MFTQAAIAEPQGRSLSQLKLKTPKLGDIKISQWSNLPFRNSSNRGMNLILVERICSEKKGLLQKPLWLVWIGGEMLALLFFV